MSAVCTSTLVTKCTVLLDEYSPTLVWKARATECRLREWEKLKETEAGKEGETLENLNKKNVEKY